MFRGVVIVALVVCALVCAFGGVAYADNKEAAKQAYTDGKRQYDIGDYGAALEAFKKAYLNYEEPVFLFNIAQCYRALGDRPGAVRSYRAFLRNWPKAPNREQVERIVTELEAAIAQDETAKKTPPVDTLAPKNGEEAKPAASASSAPSTTPPPTGEAAPTTKPQTPANGSGPAVAAKAAPPKHEELVGMEEVEPNFERPSGSAKPVKWWAWTLIAVAVGGVVAASVAIGVTQSQQKFDNTLPQFNVNNSALRTLTVRF